jgi:hypothetical protein
MHSPLLQGNFCDEHGKALKPAITQDYLWIWFYCIAVTHMFQPLMWPDNKCN